MQGKLPKEAGRYEWSESGMELLRLVRNQINNTGVDDRAVAKEASFMHVCDKEDCYFCDKFNLTPAKPAPVEKKEATFSYMWQRWEKDIILNDPTADIEILVEFLPLRSRRSIRYYRKEIAHKLGYKFVNKIWTKYEPQTTL